MLAYDEQQTLLMAMLEQGQKPYTELLKLLERMAQQQRISQMAEAAGLYLKEFPRAERQLQADAAQILAEHYFAQQLNPASFAQWCSANPLWAQPIERALSSPTGLVAAVKHMTQKAQQTPATD